MSLIWEKQQNLGEGGGGVGGCFVRTEAFVLATRTEKNGMDDDDVTYYLSVRMCSVYSVDCSIDCWFEFSQHHVCVHTVVWWQDVHDERSEQTCLVW